MSGFEGIILLGQRRLQWEFRGACDSAVLYIFKVGKCVADQPVLKGH